MLTLPVAGGAGGLAPSTAATTIPAESWTQWLNRDL
jgi:hypothetical protein